MCESIEVESYSFRWITYLVLITGIYTFIHWFLVTPLTYSHIYECCNETWPKDWVIWFLAASLVTWFVVALVILLLWLCARSCCGQRLNESNIRLTEIKNEKKKYSEEERGVSGPFGEEIEAGKNKEEPKEEMVILPDMEDPKENLAIVNVNEVRCFEDRIPPPADFTIPLDAKQHFVQTGEETEDLKKENSVPLKSPREIFFKDLIEAASKSPDSRNSYFDFDFNTNKFSLKARNSRDSKSAEVSKGKEEAENEKDVREEEEKEEEFKEDKKDLSKSGNTFFIGSRCNPTSVTSELYVALDERGLVKEQAALGEFRILK